MFILWVPIESCTITCNAVAYTNDILPTICKISPLYESLEDLLAECENKTIPIYHSIVKFLVRMCFISKWFTCTFVSYLLDIMC